MTAPEASTASLFLLMVHVFFPPTRILIYRLIVADYAQSGTSSVMTIFVTETFVNKRFRRTHPVLSLLFWCLLAIVPPAPFLLLCYHISCRLSVCCLRVRFTRRFCYVSYIFFAVIPFRAAVIFSAASSLYIRTAVRSDQLAWGVCGRSV